MSDYEDVLKAFREDLHAPHHPQIRIYLLSAERPSAARLSEALPDYEIVLPRSNDNVAFIRPITIGSEEQFSLECDRVAEALAPLLVADTYLGCLYDDAAGVTRFNIELRKTSTDQKFADTDAASDA